MFKKPLFWVIFSILVVAATVFCLQNFDELMGFINLDITMDRNEAITSAESDMSEWELGPEDHRSAVVFLGDSYLQYYIELEAGGKEAYNQFLSDGLYQPYQWFVRHFKPDEEKEVRVYYTPDGKLYGFSEIVPESEERPNLSEPEAKVMAESAAEKLDIDLTQFELIETKTKETLSGRLDYTFVYERPQLLEKARYRCQIAVSGNKVSNVTRSMKVPEAFRRRYQEMRSANNTIASSASYAMLFLYGLLGIGLGSFLLLKARYLLYKKAVLWAFIVSFLGFLAGFNQLPISWFWYDTAVSPSNHITQTIMMNLMQFLQDFILLAVSFIAAESLSRKAFPNRIQFWKNLSSESAPSLKQLGNTLGAYGMVALNLAFVLSFYMFTANKLGWWNPAGLMVDPNFIAMPMPWLSVLSMALHAGFWEEALFRAVPLAGMILIGRKLGKDKLFLVLGLILQALIFSAGHANYAAQPSYARVVELIVPSLVFAFLYLRFGLYTGIILHFVFDAVLMAMYIWIMKAPGIWINRVLVIIGILLPLIIILFYRLKKGKWQEVPEKLLNRSWRPKPSKEKAVEMDNVQIGLWNKKNITVLAIIAIISLIGWFFFTDITPDQQKFTLSRTEAISIAQKAFDAQDGVSELEWRVGATITRGIHDADKLVWQTGGEVAYRDALGKYIRDRCWYITFRSFSGDVVDRAESYAYTINNDGKIISFTHNLPEDREGASLTESDAREVAFGFVKDFYGVNKRALSEISASPNKLPSRTDWTFTWKDTLNYPLNVGEWRYIAEVKGDDVLRISTYTYVPQEWLRADRNRSNSKVVFHSATNILSILLYLSIAVMAVISWSRGNFNKRVFFFILILMILSSLILRVNQWQEATAGFSTSQPWNHQVLQYILGSFVQVIALSFIFAMITGFLGTQTQNNNQKLPYLPVIFAALAFGGVAAFAEFLNPGHLPWRPDVSEFTNYLPALTPIMQNISHFVTSTLLFMFIIQTIHKFSLSEKNRSFLSFLIVFLFLMITSPSMPVYGENADFIYLIACVLLRALLLLFIFGKLLKYDLTVLPVFMAVTIALKNLRLILAAPAGHTVIALIVADVLILVLAFQWTRLIRCKKED